MISAKIDNLTQAWIRNESDRKAARIGCRFDLERAMFAVWWIERHCRLYEGRERDVEIFAFTQKNKMETVLECKSGSRWIV